MDDQLIPELNEWKIYRSPGTSSKNPDFRGLMFRFSSIFIRFQLRKVEAKKIKNMIRVGHLAAGAIAGELAMLGISQTRSVSRTAEVAER